MYFAGCAVSETMFASSAISCHVSLFCFRCGVFRLIYFARCLSFLRVALFFDFVRKTKDYAIFRNLCRWHFAVKADKRPHPPRRETMNENWCDLWKKLQKYRNACWGNVAQHMGSPLFSDILVTTNMDGHARKHQNLYPIIALVGFGPWLVIAILCNMLGFP